MSEQQGKPSGNRLNTAATVITWIVLGSSAVYGYAVDRSVSATLAKQVADHEDRIRHMERAQSEMAADVRWIRRTLELRGVQ